MSKRVTLVAFRSAPPGPRAECRHPKELARLEAERKARKAGHLSYWPMPIDCQSDEARWPLPPVRATGLPVWMPARRRRREGLTIATDSVARNTQQDGPLDEAAAMKEPT